MLEKEAAVRAARRRRLMLLGPAFVAAMAYVDRDGFAAHLEDLEQQGVERLYTWFTDFARPETLAAVGDVLLAR